MQTKACRGRYVRSQFTGLGNFEICARLLNREPFLGKSLPPLATGRVRRDIIMRRSREKYSTKRVIVERRIEQASCKWNSPTFTSSKVTQEPSTFTPV